MAQCKHPDGCPQDVDRLGWCGLHYMRVYRNGAPGPVERLTKRVEPRGLYANDLERFMSKVEPDTQSSCLLWMRNTNNNGYGMFCADGYKGLAHRWIFKHAYDMAPEAVLHSCDTPRCVNLVHLMPGTQADNVADMWAKGRSGVTKLTDDEVRELRTEASKGILTHKMLAEAYGMSRSHISAVICGRSRESP